MSAADTVADLVGAARAACAAIDAANSRFPWLADRKVPDQWICMGEHLLSSWSDQKERPEKPRNRLASRCAPLSELRAAGWSIVQVPVLHDFAELLGSRLAWFYENEWLVIPPEGSPHRARKFKGPASAQIWATEQLAAAGASPREGA